MNGEKVNWMPCKARSIHIFCIIHWNPSPGWWRPRKNEGAVRMISELAKLLRVSLSRGKTSDQDLSEDELQHSRSYMNIQQARYKDRFSRRNSGSRKTIEELLHS